jgi:hypothetical protein
MARRVNSPLLLVGSLPVGDTETALPPSLRFQIGLPFPASALNAFKARFGHDYPIAERAYEELVERELARLLDAVPADRLAIQWDCAYETQDIEGAGPRVLRSEDERYVAPLATLEPGDARVCLGIVLPLDGEPGLRRRHATAARFIDDFGVAMYCGFGRQPGRDGLETMREHRDVVSAVVG